MQPDLSHPLGMVNLQSCGVAMTAKVRDIARVLAIPTDGTTDSDVPPCPQASTFAILDPR